MWSLPTLATRWDTQRATNAAATWQSTTVTPNASAHTKGSWAPLRTLLYDTSLLVVRGNGATSNGVARPMLLDLGIGATGSEAVLIANLEIGFHTAGQTWAIPCAIAAGTQLSARCQSANTTTLAISVEATGELPLAGGLPPVATWTTYGADTANSRGTAVTPGNSSAWGSWTSIGTTSADHECWLFNACMGNNAATTALSYRTQIAFGSSTAQADAAVTAMSHIDGPWFSLNTSELLTRFDMSPGSQALYYPVPSGLNCYVRASSSGTAQTIYVSGHGGSI